MSIIVLYLFSVYFLWCLKAVSHQRRRRRDVSNLSVAAVAETSPTKKMACALTKETSPRLLQTRWQALCSAVAGMLLQSFQVVAATSPRRFLVATSLRDVSGSRGDVSETFPGSRGDLAGSLHWVSARLRRRRGDVSAVADIISLRDVAATDGDVSETGKSLQKNRTCLNFLRLFGDSVIFRRRLGDVAETSLQLAKSGVAN